jgi:hypothetical protein
MTPEEIIQLAKLLVKYHNSITKTNSSIYGEKMDKALCRDTFTTLFTQGHAQFDELNNVQKGFLHLPINLKELANKGGE